MWDLKYFFLQSGFLVSGAWSAKCPFFAADFEREALKTVRFRGVFGAKPKCPFLMMILAWPPVWATPISFKYWSKRMGSFTDNPKVQVWIWYNIDTLKKDHSTLYLHIFFKSRLNQSFFDEIIKSHFFFFTIKSFFKNS